MDGVQPLTDFQGVSTAWYSLVPDMLAESRTWSEEYTRFWPLSWSWRLEAEGPIPKVWCQKRWRLVITLWLHGGGLTARGVRERKDKHQFLLPISPSLPLSLSSLSLSECIVYSTLYKYMVLVLGNMLLLPSNLKVHSV